LQFERGGNNTRYFGGVVEAALPDAGGVQRHGDEQVGARAVRYGFCQVLSQDLRDGESAVVFQRGDELVDGKAVAEGGDAMVKGGRVFQAGAAGLAVRRGNGALRTLRQGVVRQFATATAAHPVSARCGAA